MLACPWVLGMQGFWMRLAVWESHSALTPRKLLVRCRCKTQGRSGEPIENPSFCISGAPGFTLLSPEGLVNLVRARNVERMEEQFFFLFVLARCGVGMNSSIIGQVTSSNSRLPGKTYEPGT